MWLAIAEVKQLDEMTDSSIIFGSVLGVIIGQEEEKDKDVFICCYVCLGYAVLQLVEACATSLKVAGSNPDGVIGIFR
jgi:hypothetical protein